MASHWVQLNCSLFYSFSVEMLFIFLEHSIRSINVYVSLCCLTAKEMKLFIMWVCFKHFIANGSILEKSANKWKLRSNRRAKDSKKNQQTSGHHSTPFGKSYWEKSENVRIFPIKWILSKWRNSSQYEIQPFQKLLDLSIPLMLTTYSHDLCITDIQKQ